MTIDEMQKHRENLEARLRTVAAEIVDEFQRRTNLQVRSVDIDLMDDTTIGGRSRSIVTGARLIVEL